MRRIIKMSAVLLAAATLAGTAAGEVYARCGHHAKQACTMEHAVCYQDGVCVGDDCCDEDGICLYGGSCVDYAGHIASCGRTSRGHHASWSHRQGHHH